MPACVPSNDAISPLVKAFLSVNCIHSLSCLSGCALSSAHANAEANRPVAGSAVSKGSKLLIRQIHLKQNLPPTRGQIPQGTDLQLARGLQQAHTAQYGPGQTLADFQHLIIDLHEHQFEERKFPCHYESDLIKDKGNPCALCTLCERTNRMFMLIRFLHTKPASADNVIQAFYYQLPSIASLCSSLSHKIKAKKGKKAEIDSLVKN